MRLLFIKLMFLVVILVSACDFWPKELKPMAKSISQQVSGNTTAWLAGGDVVVINVASSPHYRADPLTLLEIQNNFLVHLEESLTNEQRACVPEEVEMLAFIAGDPETLDPASVEFLSAETWNQLDAFGKRLILAQAITTKALFSCN